MLVGNFKNYLMVILKFYEGWWKILAVKGEAIAAYDFTAMLAR
ncbi:hypothetical protein QWZ13_17630 [Reinekea marina]|nr:hypothetical protein [Reinekea marina]MDN3650731.1 hypothetical protein [Reinekea marina]